MQKIDFKKLTPHLLALAGFVALAFVYALPVLQGKTLNQHDTMQAKAAAESANQYHKLSGEWSAWSDSMFAGMPAYTIALDYPYAYFSKLGGVITSLLPNPIIYIFLMMLGMYILLQTLRINRLLSVLGGISFAFATYNMVSIEAGHLSKMLAIAYSPMVLAGVLVCIRGEYLKGAALTGFFMTLEVYSNHVQITYYTFFAVGIMLVVEGVKAVKNGTIKQVLLGTVAMGLAVALAVGTNAERLWNNYDYAKETIRGKSELTEYSKKQGGGDGLEKEYAFNWSYGKAETITLLVPNFYGGASNGGLTNKSETYKIMLERTGDAATAQDFIEKQAPVYWGSQPFVGGPAYAGAIIVFLCVLGCFVVKDALKWWLVATTALFVMFSWGKNFEEFNDLFFNYFPLFNKFRAVTMILSLVQVFMVTLAMLTLQAIADKKTSFEQVKMPLFISLGITTALCLVPGIMANFVGDNDTQLREYLTQAAQSADFANSIINALIADRKSMMWADAFRSLILVFMSVGLVWAFVKQKIKEPIFYGALIAITVFDLLAVDKRFFNNGDFVTKSTLTQTFEPTTADQQILQDKDPNFRIYDLTTSITSDARPSYFHKSLGGYSAAKLRRFQELVELQIAKGNRAVFNMLNVKYFIQPDAKNVPTVVPNVEVLGNAWFVKEYKIVPNADAEIKALDKFEPRQTAFIDQRFAEQVKGLTIQYDTTNNIRLIAYKPNHLTYQSNAKTEQLAVFSEMYYKGERDWNAYIDGAKVAHLRADYVLRGLKVPVGKHTIEFKFEPITVEKGKMIDLISNILLALLIGVAIFVEQRKVKP
jgi:hypothetical protein